MNAARGERVLRRVFWSDESKFTLDEPDGFNRHCRESSLPGRCHCARHSNVRVMGWVMDRWTPHATAPLDTTLFPFIEDKHERGSAFQQETTSPHVSVYNKQCFFDTDVELLDWLARSPDPNPIENIWAGMV